MNTTLLHSDAMNEFYAALSPELRMELAKHEQPVAVPAGTQLIGHGAQPDHLVIVNSGNVEITFAGMHNLVSITSPDGKVFGMRAIVSGELPELDVTTQKDCSVTLIPRDAFLKMLRQHPQMYFAIARVLSNDLVMAQHFLKNSLHKPLRRKAIAH
jgi:CRP-like cAMP-binding protein